MNAGAVIAIAASQIRDHEESEGLLELRSPEFRARSSGQVQIWVRVPSLVFATTLIPFLLLCNAASAGGEG